MTANLRNRVEDLQNPSGASEGNGSVRRLLQRSVVYLRPYWKQHVTILLGVVLAVAFDIGLPYSLKFLIDGAIVPRDGQMLQLILGGLVVLFLLASLGQLMQDFFTTQMDLELKKDLRLEMFTHLQNLPAGYFDHTQPGEVVALFARELLVVREAMRTLLANGLTPLLQLGIAVALLLVLDWRVSLVVALALFLTTLILRTVLKRATKADYEDKLRDAAVAFTVQDNVEAHLLIRAFGLRDLAVARFAQLLGRRTVSARDYPPWKTTLSAPYFLNRMVGTSTQIQQGFINILVIGVGGYLVFRGQLSAGALVAYFTLLAIADQAISRLVEFFQNLIAAATSLQRLEQIILAARPVAGVDNPIPLPGVSREIRFEQVSFGYDPDQPVLHQIACSFPVGRSVALVGRSGSGKSTLLNLLTRLYDPIEGRVLIDGHDLRQVSQTSLYAQFGVVLQDIILLNTTIRDNICLAKPEASDAEIEEAARAAEIHEAIMALPQGYQTRVGEQGKLLSPGQRQRIALARALLNKPAILLLDEATSTLDPEAEAAIQITLKKLAQHCTLIMTTHRLALAEDMDYVVVMDDGRVIEQGTPQQLLAHKNLYYRMWRLQSGFVISPDGRQARITAARLRALSFCDVLDDEAVARLSEQFTAEYYEAGQIVIAQGELADKFYLIVRGKVAVTMTDAEGKTIELAVLEDGDYFGEIALLEDSPRSATVETLLPSLLLTLPREQFHQMLEKSISMNERIKNVALKRSMEVITGQ